jgi:hypothetical protein
MPPAPAIGTALRPRFAVVREPPIRIAPATTLRTAMMTPVIRLLTQIPAAVPDWWMTHWETATHTPRIAVVQLNRTMR